MLHLLGCLLYALGASASPSDAMPSTASPPNQRLIEILITGPADARHKMEGTLRPLLGDDPDVRWAADERAPSERDLPEPSQPGAARVWIDVSDPMWLRVYLPAQSKGATSVRTLARAGSEAEKSDLLAREAVAQIVKAAILALRRGPAPAAEGETVPPAEPPGAAVSGQPAVAGTPGASPREAHRYSRLYLRMHAGPSYLHASETGRILTVGDVSESYSRLGLAFDASVGLAVFGGLIVYGQFLVAAAANVDYARSGQEQPYTGRDLFLYGFGPGLAYHFAPIDLYLSGTLAFTKLSFGSASNPPPATQLGIGGSFTVGKDWWISRDWGIGVAAQFTYATMGHHFSDQMDDFGPRLRFAAYGLLFSATYN